MAGASIAAELLLESIILTGDVGSIYGSVDVLIMRWQNIDIVTP